MKMSEERKKESRHLPRIAIIQPSLNVASETFIRAHGARLPGVAAIIDYHTGFPAIGGRPVLSVHWLHRARRKLVRMILRRNWAWEFDRICKVALRRCKADVVLAEYGTTGIRILDACRRTNIPLVVHFHGVDASKYDVIQDNAAGYKRMFMLAAAVVAVSRAMERQLLDLGCPREKLVYIPCGVDCSKFSGADPSTAGLQFVAAGRMVEKKAPHLTLAAFALVQKAYPEARLRFIGDGELLNLCKSLADAFGIKHSVTFLGAQSHEVVRQEMMCARAFVQHSITARNGDSEGTPVAVLEAGAMGLPVIATRHAGIADVVSHGETGLLVAEHDVANMEEYMRQLAREPAFAAELGHNAAAHIRRYYSMEQSIGRLALLLDAAARGCPIDTVREEIERGLPRAQLPRKSCVPDFAACPVNPWDESNRSIFHTLRRTLDQENCRHLVPDSWNTLSQCV